MKFLHSWTLVFFTAIATGSAQQQPITYKYKTEININNEKDFELSKELEVLAQACYPQLKTSLFFNTKYIQQPQEVRQWHRDRLGAQFFNVTTQDGISIPCTFFDRNSDHLIVIGEGFTNQREVMSPFVAMFEDADIVLFDFRGHGYDEANPPSLFSSSLSKYFFDADAHVATLAKKEELDVIAIVNHIKQLKNKPDYKVHGIGVCYAALIFLKTEALYPKTFDKLVLDGCWISLQNFLEKLKKDLRLTCIPQEGGWKNHWLLKRQTIQNALEPVASSFFGFNLANISIIDIIEKNKNNLQQIPLLLFQGKDDLMILRNEFGLLWDAIPTPNKVAIITSNPHIRNHWKQKELYALLCKLFFELEQPNFVQAITTPVVACQHMITKMQARLIPFLTPTQVLTPTQAHALPKLA